MMLTELAKEIDRLNQELAEQTDKTMQAWVKMLDMVPKRDYDALIGSVKVTQNMIESLMVALRKHDPASPIAHDASIILGGLEAIVTPARMKEDYNFINHLSPVGVFGTVKKEHKP